MKTREAVTHPDHGQRRVMQKYRQLERHNAFIQREESRVRKIALCEASPQAYSADARQSRRTLELLDRFRRIVHWKRCESDQAIGIRPVRGTRGIVERARDLDQQLTIA